jgi:hypothetical protein
MPAFIPPASDKGLSKPAAGTYDIKAMYYENPGNLVNQRGWRTEDPVEIAKFAWATYLEFEIDASPDGGGTINLQSDYNGWSSGLQIFNSTGGTLQNGASLIAGSGGAKDRIRVDLSVALGTDTFYKYLPQTEELVGVIIGYWGGTIANMEQLGVTATSGAWLIVE